ncbi:Integrase-type DNA-binding superfamily protein [Tripterygium wilfordii]|uniref:Integrase-type DNA-binding superfamily protein n=1 Tax=Tripterygium wilfordii TaxID=458696 RepID=A0A7J7DMH7_TRIWF|nr:AP2-like ethylene-responsive transcription factor ANT [Tripterygium wilfordii]KAF5747286.1 Integrase-type DNA-binding superfamily protein [Tripterygium wilfordii]
MEKIKSFNNNDPERTNSNWLGFSLSPHPQNQTQPSPAAASAASSSATIPTSLSHSTQQVNYGIYYGVEGENGGVFSPLPVMPIKCDGSLCLMEAITRSQSQARVTTSTPKLEDFFGGVATMGTHPYESNEREAMALSLDSIFYHQNADHNNSNNENCLNHIQENSRQHEDQLQQYPYNYSAMELPTMADDGLSGMKNWISSSHAIEQKVLGCMGYNGGESSGRSLSAMSAYGDLQSLSLSMSPGSRSSCVTASQLISPIVTDCVAMETNKKRPKKVDQKQIIHRKSLNTFGQRTSQYRGVTRHRWTGRYEAHLWDNSCKKEGQSRKGRQVYLGGYDMEEKAARAYDLAALKYWGPSTHINFTLENYQKELVDMKNMTRQEYVAHLRRKSSGFSRGASMYRGVTRHHQHGRWQARIGRVAGNKDLYLGTFSTQEEAAEAYDIAAIKFRGVNAVTNFDITRYDVERIMASNTLLAGELARRSKETGPDNEAPNNNGEGIPLQKNNIEADSDLKMAFKSPNVFDSCKNQSLSLVPENHLSNASSLVTSLSSSREGSPDKSNSLPMMLPMPPSATKLFTTTTSTTSNIMNSWTQLKPGLSYPPIPVFAAWTDA